MIGADGRERPMVIVRVPATSANVGVGFDCLGIALDLTATFLMTPSDRLEVEGCEQRFRGEDNLVWQSYLDACERLGTQARPLHITILSPIPLSGGLGSSSACVIAGIGAAMALSPEGFDRARALELAVAIEGHPDNVAPALLGGLVSSFVDERGQTTSTRMGVAGNLRFVAVAPPYEVRTAEARRVLPTEVTRETAVWQMGRCVAVVRALELGDAALLAAACHDRLHEPYRAKLIPDYEPLREAALAAGACAYMISGSGSTMLAVADGDETAARVADALRAERPDFWLQTLPANTLGTTVEVH
ncbi:homoserine kinase [Thermophilibacter sp. ET337]|uniref:homoserine kinase n=1 Tax=Thermophilibacter sp. ET337 TaxID=2973084 RepID=UPI0021ACBC6D|nr:homoserine kinase [Thermophilibacter sp. ET337]MCR8908781.1 homoserine kinase [Thermophilibacter sp. ET337]